MDQQTIETYNKLAKDYDSETSDFWDRFPPTILNEFAKRTKGKILDAGSGPGRDGLLLKEKGFEVICLDASETMVALAKTHGLNTILGDFKKMDFCNASFDGVWAYTSLLHIPKSETKEALAELARVLKPGGTLGLGMIEGDWEGYYKSSGMSLPRWFAFYSREELESLLRSFNFEIVYFEEFKPGSKKYLNYIARKN